MYFFGAFFKVENLLIGNDLQKILEIITNIYCELY